MLNSSIKSRFGTVVSLDCLQLQHQIPDRLNALLGRHRSPEFDIERIPVTALAHKVPCHKSPAAAPVFRVTHASIVDDGNGPDYRYEKALLTAEGEDMEAAVSDLSIVRGLIKELQAVKDRSQAVPVGGTAEDPDRILLLVRAR